jgi:methyl-accepting chemotaxis protein
VSSSLVKIAKNAQDGMNISSDANTSAQETLNTMSQLEETAKKIGRVVKLIDSIAGQTNMLALNATIEAASAGEAGKGFAVVAGEIKELAQQTTLNQNEN